MTFKIVIVSDLFFISQKITVCSNMEKKLDLPQFAIQLFRSN